MEAVDSSETLIPIYQTTKVNNSTSQKTLVIVLTVVRTSNLISVYLSSYRRNKPTRQENCNCQILVSYYHVGKRVIRISIY
jgi:hypothetical protein